MTGERLAYSVAELSELSGIPRSTLFKLVRSGELKAVTYGTRGLIVTREAWEAFVQRGEARARPASRPRQKRPRIVGGAA